MTLLIDTLSVMRGGIVVLEDVSFSLSAGQALVLRGPNGIGKTTLLRTIAGLQPAASGSVRVADDSIAYAAHSDGIKQALSVQENLEFWAAVFGTGDIEPALKAYALELLRQRPAGALSAGQKRRLGLARLLVTGRPIWVLDEPTVSLDSAACELFINAVSAHLDSGGIAVLATHIDLGIKAERLDLTPFKARPPEALDDAMEGFL